jgi:GLPGLI family protein
VKKTLNILNRAIVILTISFLFGSCSHDSPKFISEGVIEYEASVVDKDHPMAGLAPNGMSMFFKNDLFCSEMTTMGVFTSKFVANPHNKTFTTMVKVFDMKNACIEDEKQIKKELEAYKFNFEETSETKVIAGYKCKKVIATNVTDPTDKFDIYYTDELNVKKANYSTPYEGIKGLVMQFRLQKFGMEMEFKAKSVRKEEIPDNMFDLPGFYKVISKEEMDAFFKSIQ